jgi:hypothetical protein
MDRNRHCDTAFFHHVVAAVAAGLNPAVLFQGFDNLFTVHDP